MREIADSGKRREFSSGAVRDIAEGKGRMDLMPLDVIALFCDYWFEKILEPSPKFDLSLIMHQLSYFMDFGCDREIFFLLRSFVLDRYHTLEDALLDLSIHYEQGAKKYCERNWEKGIDAHCFVDSALRHGVKFLRGDDDEPHDRALMWNLFGLLWTIKHKPEFNDLIYSDSLAVKSDTE